MAELAAGRGTALRADDDVAVEVVTVDLAEDPIGELERLFVSWVSWESHFMGESWP